MENLEKIKILSYELISLYKVIDKNREIWHSHTNKLINRTFKQVIRESKLHLHICTYNEILNLESIQLTFGMLNSGLIIEMKKKKNAIPPMVMLKRGGLLAYSLLANGRVSVVIQYPYIEEIFGDPQHIKELGVYSPGEVNYEMIIRHVEIFLEEMIQWEKEEKKLIGFQLRKSKH